MAIQGHIFQVRSGHQRRQVTDRGLYSILDGSEGQVQMGAGLGGEQKPILGFLHPVLQQTHPAQAVGNLDQPMAPHTTFLHQFNCIACG